jgi:class 3 adenylate cyclase/CHASE2 domain-containing sensor protein
LQPGRRKAPQREQRVAKAAERGEHECVTPRQRRAASLTVLIGLAATLGTLGAHWAGWLDVLENITLDLRFRHANTLREHPDLACIDIDDASLTKIGRWPWSREAQAALIAVPAELGARRILVDLNWVEEETLGLDLPENLDLLQDPIGLLGLALPLRLPDDALRKAIADAANVYLAVVYDPDAWEQSGDFAAAVAAHRAGQRDPDALARQLRVSRARATHLSDAARIVAALEADILLDAQTAAVRADVDPQFAVEVFERCRFFVMRAFIDEQLRENPQLRELPMQEACHALYATLVGRRFDDDTPQKSALLKKFRERLGYEATIRNPPAHYEMVASIAAEADAVVPVYYTFARAAQRCGFVKFDPDSDGVMRRNALFAVHHGHVLGQLAFMLACDELEVGPDDMEVRPGAVTLRPRKPGAGPLTLQLDDRGRVVVPWVPQRDWVRQFGQHMPADALVQVHDRRRQIEENARKLHVERAAFFGSSFFDDPASYQRLVDRWHVARADLLLARYRGQPVDVEQANAALTEIDVELDAAEQRLFAESLAERDRRWLTPFASGASPRLDALDFRIRQFPSLGALAADLAGANAGLRQEIDRTLAWLRPRLENKICLIGYTATALADMTPIPTHPRAPGVIAHANLLNGLLQGGTVRWTTPWQNALLAGVAGLFVTLASAAFRPRVALLVAAALFVLLSAAAALAFYTQVLWITIVPALLAVVSSYVAIASYRYAFIDRERRQLATSLSQYTSAALARQMAENAELCKRAETREVTAMFTDFAGFTTISERIGAERTQRVLNISLGRISDVMLRHEAMINKFIGDGVFAFWNPVIYPQPDHAQRACATAVELLERLEALIHEQQEAGGDDTFTDLRLRIGVASGRAVVGPCGSEQKYDYTCIGDSVNVASRLESANKFFGTRILTNEATRAALNSTYAFRPLGQVRVKGRLQPVGVFELVGLPDRVPAAVLEYAELFGNAVRLFQEGRWAEARAAFDRCLARRPADLAAEFYALTAGAYEQNPPAADEWIGTIELTEK